MPNPQVESFFHADTGTFTHVAFDPATRDAVVVDPVLDFDAAAARTSTASADAVLEFIRRSALRVHWILETHVHADHLSAAGRLCDALGAPVAIGRGIVALQQRGKRLFGLSDEFLADGSQFQRLLEQDEVLTAGSLQVRVLATPGHTPDSLTYRVGDAAFVGDTLFAPDVGTARTDFPGGDAAQLYASIRAILALPPATRLFLCHDYPPAGRVANAQTTVAAQRAQNMHVRDGVAEAEFVAKRRARDATLPVPRLILPALQVNLRGGRLPPAEADGVRYLRLPIDRFDAP